MFIRHIDKCHYVLDAGGVPICKLNVLPCEKVNPKDCEAIEEIEDELEEKEEIGD